MARLIDADRMAVDIKFQNDILRDMGLGDYAEVLTKGFLQEIDNQPTVDAVPVCRCKDCKHRPTKPEKYTDGFDLEFPDEVCPCYCDDDPFYSRYPHDDWFCPRGERKGGDE